MYIVYLQYKLSLLSFKSYGGRVCCVASFSFGNLQKVISRFQIQSFTGASPVSFVVQTLHFKLRKMHSKALSVYQGLTIEGLTDELALLFWRPPSLILLSLLLPVILSLTSVIYFSMQVFIYLFRNNQHFMKLVQKCNENVNKGSKFE